VSSRLAGKTAFVTAAGQGIGRATVEAFAREGAQVIATDVNEALLAGLAGAPGVTTHQLDVMDPAAIAAAAKRAGAVDVLFNAAGYVHAGTLLDCSEADWDLAFDLNAGSIINVASMAGSPKAFANRFVYSASKAAVIGMTKSVALDYIQRGIRCNAICPGTVESPSLRERIAAQAQASGKTLAEVEAMFVGRQPMGRLGRAEEIAALAVYLASDESSYTTGTTQYIDGGTAN
jgi:2-keto-3-deoxy-L-fuconate dehydrogenase